MEMMTVSQPIRPSPGVSGSRAQGRVRTAVLTPPMKPMMGTASAAAGPSPPTGTCETGHAEETALQVPGLQMTVLQVKPRRPRLSCRRPRLRIPGGAEGARPCSSRREALRRPAAPQAQIFAVQSRKTSSPRSPVTSVGSFFSAFFSPVPYAECRSRPRHPEPLTLHIYTGSAKRSRIALTFRRPRRQAPTISYVDRSQTKNTP